MLSDIASAPDTDPDLPTDIQPPLPVTDHLLGEGKLVKLLAYCPKITFLDADEWSPELTVCIYSHCCDGL